MNWDTYFRDIAETVSSKSEDPATKVGCVVVDDDNYICATGYNGLPKGVKPTPERLQRPVKYLYFSHAERNAIFQAAKRGVSLNNCRLYCQWVPCCDCARAIIQVGIVEVVIDEKHREEWESKDNWKESMDATLQMFAEAQVRILVIDEHGFIKPYTPK